MAALKQGELSQFLLGGVKSGVSVNSELDSLFANAPAPAPVKKVQPAPAPFALPEKDETNEDSSAPTKKEKKKKRKDKDDKSADARSSATADLVRGTKKLKLSRDNEMKAKEKRARRIGYRNDEDDLEDEAIEAEEAESQKKKQKKNLLGRMPQDPEVLKRTLFIGNLIVQSITDRKVHNELRELCKKYGEIKAVRFRSIAFAELLPRKIAFIRGKFHSERESCNAYVEFVEEESAKGALALNGTEFHERHIRVDTAANDKAYDSKRSVFVGNLDFAAEEEALWKHFNNCGTVENVRIIRDPKTNLGKGFAYVQFTERAPVSLALKLHGTDIGGRKLRVQRASDKVIKQKKRAEGAAAGPPASGIIEGTRSSVGDKPSNKKRRTARSKSFAEKRLNSASNTSTSSKFSARRPANKGARVGRGKPKGRS
ncbi:Nucleolar protein 12 [Coemansia guatemalensis]|uniref:Nucleolar protein 12 n=1 Tax=Coemansia guatemalensis TaxID=2761395 RepID=A0A9W8LUV6_9FUNG|nr:Nucleolar protein 12 [Coemansia guatemalensis]